MYRLIVILCLLCAVASADPLGMRAGIDIDTVDGTGVTWQVSGTFHDCTPSGFTPYDVATGAVIACESPYGDVDVYTITNVVSATATRLSVLCDYIGTNGTPRVGGPTFGAAVVADSIGSMIVGQQDARVSAYLQAAAAWVSAKQVAAGAPGAEVDPVFSSWVATNIPAPSSGSGSPWMFRSGDYHMVPNTNGASDNYWTITDGRIRTK